MITDSGSAWPLLLVCGEQVGLMTGVAMALPINGEKVGPLIGVVGADSDCLYGKISSANQTLLLPLGGVPKEKQRF